MIAGLVLASALVAFAGCGESGGDRVESSLEDFLAALETRDGEKACGRLSSDARVELLAPILFSGATETADPQALDDAGICVSVVSSLDVRAVEAVADVADADVEGVDVDKDGAVVTTKGGTYEFGARDGDLELLSLDPLAKALEEAEALDPERIEGGKSRVPGSLLGRP